jgi:hypothetical protein
LRLTYLCFAGLFVWKRQLFTKYPGQAGWPIPDAPSRNP